MRRLRRLAELAPRNRAARRQLRKALGKHKGLEWRLFGNVTRRWVYARPNRARTGGEITSRSGGWTSRHPIQAVKDPARDDLNTEIAHNAQTRGHLLGRPK